MSNFQLVLNSGHLFLEKKLCYSEQICFLFLRYFLSGSLKIFCLGGLYKKKTIQYCFPDTIQYRDINTIISSRFISIVVMFIVFLILYSVLGCDSHYGMKSTRILQKSVFHQAFKPYHWYSVKSGSHGYVIFSGVWGQLESFLDRSLVS